MTPYEEAIAELRTVRDLIRWGMSRFHEAGLYFGHGTDNGLDEAAYLILHTLHLPPRLPDGYLDAQLTRRERKQVVAQLKRRVEERIPAPYLTREAWFAGRPYYVDERVLIPRSPLAEIIEARFQPWIEADRVARILDLCTGSGCIAIACAHAFPEATVDALDNAPEALEVALINVEEHDVEDRVAVIASDLFAAASGERYDIIVSNPPYVDAADMAQRPEEFHHEPIAALAAGEDGLELAIRILRDAVHHLQPWGILIMEVGNSDAALIARCPDLPFNWLTLERGGGGILMLTARQLRDHHHHCV